MDLRTYLRQSGTTPGAFAAQAGITYNSLYRYMSGERFPRQQVLRRIAEATGGAVQANDFVGPHEPADTAEGDA